MMSRPWQVPIEGVDAISFVPFVLEAYRGNRRFEGWATGFVWWCEDVGVLVSNWHVFSHRNQETKACLRADGGTPDRLVAVMPLSERGAEPARLEIPILDADGDPLWSTHPVLGDDADIAAIAIERPPAGIHVQPLNTIQQLPLRRTAGGFAHVIGFPFERDRYGLPIWKLASFASEPWLSPAFQPYLLVDTASRPGMSGSPVFQRERETVTTRDGRNGMINNGQGACEFVGIYSGRLRTSNDSEVQLGKVWHAQLVEETAQQAAETWRGRQGAGNQSR